MTVPGRVEAASLLCSLDPPDWLVRHSRAVAEAAAFLAERVAARGIPIDRRIVESAALLHDIDKTLPPDDPHRSLAHGLGSAAWLTDRGLAPLAPAVADHPVGRLQDAAWFGEWLRASRLEDRIVAYADKRAGQRLESMDARFASWRRRYPDGWDGDTAARVHAAARRLEDEVCTVAGVEPGAVARLPWTRRAFAAARRS